MPIVYVLFSKKSDKRYVGSSRGEKVSVRLKAHNGGKVRSTKFGRPWEIILEEKYDTYTEARKREIFLKTGQGRKWLNNHIPNNYKVKMAEEWPSG